MKLISIIMYLLFVNILGYSLMGVDKKRARKGAYRISERTLFSVAMIGGSIGSIAGMKHFRHKTKHKTFTIGMPIILLLQIILLFLRFMSNT